MIDLCLCRIGRWYRPVLGHHFRQFHRRVEPVKLRSRHSDISSGKYIFEPLLGLEHRSLPHFEFRLYIQPFVTRGKRQGHCN